MVIRVGTTVAWDLLAWTSKSNCMNRDGNDELSLKKTPGRIRFVPCKQTVFLISLPSGSERTVQFSMV